MKLQNILKKMAAQVSTNEKKKQGFRFCIADSLEVSIRTDEARFLLGCLKRKRK